MALSNNNKLKLIIFLAVALAVVFAGSAQADLQVDSCQTLYAGQSINAGTVCVEVSEDDLVVTYTTLYGWELTEAHLWVGTALAVMPQTKKGNPKVGNFPYHSGDITGSTSYEFTIPLTDLGGDAFATILCNETFLVAAHAALRKDNGSGGYQTETGWADGYSMVQRGNWATYFEFQFSCDDPNGKCETAFAFYEPDDENRPGNIALWDIVDVETGEPITNRWGWQIEVHEGDNLSKPIYAGAGQNDITKGTLVGELVYSYAGGTLTVSYNLHSGFTLDETHLYVGTEQTQTGAPGQFGYSNDLSDVSTDTYEIEIEGDPYTIYIVAHAVVCGEFE
ncbi:MAG: hypothetical protein ACYSUJ_13785 [Planctomycetota bacterium]